MPLRIVRDDICHLKVDAIVNAANEQLREGGGVCGAVFAAAGASKLQAACDRIGHCDTGSAVATPAFRLKARHVIHAVGPVWRGGGHGEERALRSCYRTALELAARLGDRSIAFPLISSGVFGYPKEQAIDVALAEIRSFLNEHDMDVRLVIFDAEALRAGARRFLRVAAYIDDTYVLGSPYRRRKEWEEGVRPAARPSLGSARERAKRESEPSEDREVAAPSGAHARAVSFQGVATPRSAPVSYERKGLLKRLLSNLDEGFSTTLLAMIDERGLKDSEVYKRANMSRQHFSKIRNNPRYRPKKQTVLALAVALELSEWETRLLLERAGFALTHSDERDVIVEYFIRCGEYDIYEINLALYTFDQPLLG